MTARFAGAADLGHRRRRRLASEEPENDLASDTPEAPFLILPTTAPESTEIVEARLLRKVISPRLWKHIGMLTFAAIVLTGVCLTPDQSLQTLRVNPVAIADRLCGLLLLLAAQLALLTGWLRGRSEVDFRGRYRWWKWMAVILATTSLLQLIGLTDVMPQLMVRILEPLTGRIVAARYAVVLVPGITCLAVVLSRIIPDMNRCLYSQGLLITGLLVIATRLLLTFSGAADKVAAETLAHLQVAAAFCTFAAMLLHCRYVAYVSPDPPARQKPKVVSRRAA